MAIVQTFGSARRSAVVAVSTANTNRDGTGTIVSVISGVAASTKVTRMVFHSSGNPADSILTLFKHNGTSYFIYDEVDLADPAAGSTTLSAYHGSMTPAELWLPTASWQLGAAITVALTAGVMNVHAEVEDYT